MFEPILNAHISRYPAMQIRDLYKLIHQAALGSEHAISDPDSARSWLMREMEEMGEGRSELLMDPISANGEIVRVHLRTYAALELDPELLLNAFLRTSTEYHKEARLLEQYWSATVLAGLFPTVEMDDFFRDMRAKNFPAVHHSSEYNQLYRPAYRVVAAAFCPENWW